MQTEIYLLSHIYDALIAALMAAATKLVDLPELVDVNDIVIALGEAGGIFPDTILQAEAA